MYGILYIGAIVGVIVFAILLFVFYKLGGRVYGRTLSQWIDKTRRKNDEISAEKLFNIRKRFEVLAHDILKHRLLGLASLIEEIREELKVTPQLPPEKLEAYRVEFFRLAGLKINPEERLWTRWQLSLGEIYRYANKNILAPSLDPMFQDVHKLLSSMRAIMLGFIDEESLSSHFIDRIVSLPFEKCVQLYPTCLELGAACRMVIQPETIIQKAIEMLAAQARRGGSHDKVRIYNSIDRQLLCPAPMNMLIICLTRLLDNALNIGDQTAIDIEVNTDEYTCESFMILKVYDISDHIPAQGDYGVGIRGIHQRVVAFDGGFQYRLENRDGFKKAAVISFPVSEYSDFTITHQNVFMRVVIPLISLILVSGFVFSLFYVLGGPPVGFGGQGTNITEFTVSVGDELVIPLCEGGRNVRVETQSVNDVCLSETCSFGQVLNALEPCSRSLDDPQCPGEIRWTPQFSDGQRQGKNYELTIHCIAAGPPASEDMQRIRIIVKRANSAPQVLVTQLYNETRGQNLYVENDKTLKVGATDKLYLRVMATDADADMISYRMRLPNGHIQTSSNGVFPLEVEWSQFGTSTFELEVSDNLAPSVTIPVVLEADVLHPVELQSMGLWSKERPSRVPCEGAGDSRICYITDNLSNVIDMDVWFDPLLPRLRPVITIQIADDEEDLEIHASHAQAFSQIGDQWEIYSPARNQILSFLELTNIEKLSQPGAYRFSFNYITPNSFSDYGNLSLNLNIREQTGRLPELNTFIFFAKKYITKDAFSLSSKHIELREYYQDDQQVDAASSIWVYPAQHNKSTSLPVLGPITCQTPEFAQAFEKPVIRDHHNTWRIDFKLKRGCIPGLAKDLDGKARLCAVDIHLGDDQSQSNAIWIMLEPRSCEPQIDELTLISTKEELAENRYRWRFDISDADGDVGIEQIDMVGNHHYEIAYDAQKPSLGSHFRGVLAFTLSCETPDLNQIRQKIGLRVRDSDNHEIVKKLTLPLMCPPLVTTANNQVLFEVEDNTHLEIPLIHDKDVRLNLNSRIGTIVDDKFVWDVTCLYGRGPHLVEVRTESLHRYGRPFQFEVQVRHCQPHFSLTLDGQAYDTQTPIFLPVGNRRLLGFSGERTSEFDMVTGSDAKSTKVQLTPVPQPDGWGFELECDRAGSSETLLFQIKPKVPGSQKAMAPILIRVYCVEP